MGKLMTYFTSVIAEMKLVSWPSKAEVWQSVKIVLGFALVVILFLFVSDQLLKELVEFIIRS